MGSQRCLGRLPFLEAKMSCPLHQHNHKAFPFLAPVFSSHLKAGIAWFVCYIYYSYIVLLYLVLSYIMIFLIKQVDQKFLNAS